MTDPEDNPAPDIRQAAKDAAALLRLLRQDGPKTLPRTDEPEEDS